MSNRAILRGKQLALQALSGHQTDRVPVALFTWEFDYYWKVAGLELWQLACGTPETWHQAHMALFNRHRPDLLWYSGYRGPATDPVVVEETHDLWTIRDGFGLVWELDKTSHALRMKESGAKGCDAIGTIRSKEDADRLIPLFTGWGDTYLNGLSRLVTEVGDDALVIPHHSPAYIVSCYAFGFEVAMETMFEEPELFRYVCDRYAQGDRLRMRELAEAGAEVVFIADGWASCDIISPRQIEEFALPYQQSIVDAAHEAGLKIIMWNEGDILPILKQEAAIPMDAFAFEQPRKGVDITVKAIREVFGPNRCLLGNIDSELMLLRNDVKEITAEVESQIRQSGEGAPFILSTGSPLVSNIEPEAVDTMIAAARAFCW